MPFTYDMDDWKKELKTLEYVYSRDYSKPVNPIYRGEKYEFTPMNTKRKKKR